MITEKLLTLPSGIDYANRSFLLILFKNTNEELRLCYEIMHLDGVGDSWYNPFLKKNCNFLFLQEGIFDDEDLIMAINEAKDFLKKNNLI